MKQLHKRVPHVMKKHVASQQPSNFLFFDTETKDKYNGVDPKLSRQQFWFGMAWAFRYEKGKVTRSVKQRLNCIDDFYNFIFRRLDKSRPLYVVAHNLGFDLTQVNFWIDAEQRGMECTYAVLNDPPLFLSYKWYGHKIIFLDTFNFWKCSVEEMGKSLNIPKLEMPKHHRPGTQWDKYCLRDVEIIANQLTSLIDFLVDNDLGSFGISAPSVAMHAFKKRFMQHEIYIHDRSSVLQLERCCYYGGLVHNFFVGDLTGKKIYHTDVNSLYPSMMLKPVPCKMLESYKMIDPKKIGSELDLSCCCAWVRINDKHNPYLKRIDGRLCEVIGHYDCFLCGPELDRAYRNNSIKWIHLIAVYELAPVFTDFINFFWNKRLHFKAQNDKVREQLVKLFMNSLYGRFGMKGHDWVDYSRDNLAAYYAMHEVDMPDEYNDPEFVPTLMHQSQGCYFKGLDRPIKMQYISGKLQMYFPTGEHTETFVAIAAFITSYARERLRQLIKIAGYRNTFYCDTDSLFVNEMGLHNLKQAKEIDPTGLGKLKIEGSARNAAFFAAKDYRFNDKEVMKGIRPKAKHKGGTTFEQPQFERLRSVLKRGAEPYVDVKIIEKTNTREYHKGILSSSGWTRPFVIDEFS